MCTIQDDTHAATYIWVLKVADKDAEDCLQARVPLGQSYMQEILN